MGFLGVYIPRSCHCIWAYIIPNMLFYALSSHFTCCKYAKHPITSKNLAYNGMICAIIQHDVCYTSKNLAYKHTIWVIYTWGCGGVF